MTKIACDQSHELLDMGEFTDFIKARNKALLDLDLDWLRGYIAGNARLSGVDDEAVLAGAHKARYELAALPNHERHESYSWLVSRGYGRMSGEPLLPAGELPA